MTAAILDFYSIKHDRVIKYARTMGFKYSIKRTNSIPPMMRAYIEVCNGPEVVKILEAKKNKDRFRWDIQPAELRMLPGSLRCKVYIQYPSGRRQLNEVFSLR